MNDRQPERGTEPEPGPERGTDPAADQGGGRILVAYGTRRGGTRGIAVELGEAFREDGLAVDVLPATVVGELKAYDAVVLGGALYMYRWHRDARRFARRHSAELRRMPVWIFSSGPLDRSAEEKDIPPIAGVLRIMSRLHARGHRTFGGRLNSEDAGRIGRNMARRGVEGDYRNPEQIRAWGHEIARTLAKESAAGPDRGAKDGGAKDGGAKDGGAKDGGARGAQDSGA
ncbi:flavodoxin domain-containing protein [Phaeacidiphilus oryzae]|uniref:flavodoxin domain-containing protein n=1 Tax=Phaeacidiphilus oryzae TaxID=348818 RepID=UPI0007C6E457|nr:flavodoxin domain-containing protein [Phaeacidiphilus oryzae]